MYSARMYLFILFELPFCMKNVLLETFECSEYNTPISILLHFTPVTSLNVGIRPQNLLNFSLHLFDALL